MSSRRTLVAWVSTLLLWGLPVPGAEAQEASPRERVRRAIERYEAAIASGDPTVRRREIEAALAELEAAQRSSPQPLLEWNLAQIELELGHVVDALEHVERFVAEVPTSHARHAEAVALAASLSTRVGSVVVVSTPAGARVTVDGEPRGSTPTAPIRVPAGEVTIFVSADAYRDETRRVRVASGASATVTVTLERDLGAVGALRLESTLPDVQVTIDDVVVGSTPLATTVPLAPGDHLLVAERAGYRTDRRTISVVLGAEQTVRVALEPDPAVPGGQLTLALPAVPARLTIDGGEPRAATPTVELPLGRHRLAVEVEEREAWHGEITLTTEEPASLRPELAWQGGSFARRHDSAEAQRILGAVVTAAGAAAVIGGATAITWALAVGEPHASELARRIAACQPPATCGGINELNVNHANAVDLVAIGTGTGIALAVAGTIVVPFGLWLTLDAPSDDGIRRAAYAVRLGPSGAALEVAW